MNAPKEVDGTPSKEIVGQLPSCRDLSDIVPLYAPRALYLKPVAKVNVSVNLPQLKTPGKTISTWEVMEKIRTLALPDEFASLKVAKSTLEFIRLEGDLQDRCRLQRILARLDSQQLNLAGISCVLKVRAAEAKDDFPSRHAWDSYFRDAKHMNELKPGERPDTIHISGLPVKWFSENVSEKPSESLVAKVFSKWGTLRRIDVPAADLYRSRMRLGTNIQKFSYQDGLFFDAYIQYVEYMDFVRAMDALRGMKILKKDGQNSLTALIKVDFDKTKHMSDTAVAHREFERKRIAAQEALAADKIRKKEEAEEKRREEQRKKEAEESVARACRRQKREETRKRKALTIFRKQEEDKVSMKIAREEQKLIKAQRQLESIRLLDELFDRIKVKVENKEIKFDRSAASDTNKDDKRDSKVNDTCVRTHSGNEDDDRKKAKKASKKKKMKKERRKKRKRRGGEGSGSANSGEDTNSEETNRNGKNALTKNMIFSASAAATNRPDSVLPYPAIYPARLAQPWYYETALPMIYPTLGKGLTRGGVRYSRGRARGRAAWRATGNVRALTNFNPHLYNEQYYKYFANLVGQEYHSFDSDYDRSPKSRSRSRRRSMSRLKSRSKSRSRSRSRDGKRSRSVGGSRPRFGRRRKKSRSRTRRRTRTRTRSRSRSRSRSRTRTRSRSRSRSRSRNTSRSTSTTRLRSRSRCRRATSKRKSRNRSNSTSTKKGSSRNEYSRSRGKRNARSTSRVKVTRAKSRTKSPGRRSHSDCRSIVKPTLERSSLSKEAANKNTEQPMRMISKDEKTFIPTGCV